MTRLGSTDLDVFPLCLGGNVFGWTADDATSFAILDGYHAAGGNFVDTANSYSAWVPGNQGGESEAILGRWMKARGVRDEIVVATKVGSPLHDQPEGLGRDAIRKGATDSLTRLQTDRIDLYYAHIDDESTPLEESLGAFSELVDEGLVRAIGVSNFGPERLGEAVAITQRDGLAAISALQPHYNLVEREFEEAVLQAVTDNAEVEVPEALIHARAHDFVRQTLSALARQGIATETYLQLSGKSEHELADEAEPEAAATERIAPRVGPMQGLQAIAKAAPATIGPPLPARASWLNW